MNTYTVHLDAFEGPLDLLIHLIEKNKIDIYDIPISSLTQEYIEYLQQSESLNIELSSDFVLMATTLLVIKSKMLLPKKANDEEEKEVDPRRELVEKILEYRQFKELVPKLQALKEEAEKIYVRKPLPLKKKNLPPKNLSVKILIDALKLALSVEKELTIKEVVVTVDEYSLHQQIAFILKRLVENKGVLFFTSLSKTRKRGELIINFLALLELVRRKVVDVRQEEAFANIYIFTKRE